MNHIEKEKLIKTDIESIENRVRHAFNQGYDLGFKDGKEKTKPLEQEPQTFKWCTDCKEYDQEKHCCHRWSKVIRDTVEEMKQEPRWIPVSESLPEEYKTVIASTEYGVYPEARYSEEDGWAWAYESGADYWEELAEVKAWMPLPERYKAESEDKDDKT